MNKKTIIAVGGGEIGRVKFLPDGTAYQTEIETTQIDKFIIKASGKKILKCFSLEQLRMIKQVILI